MDITIPLDEAPVSATAVYKDRKGNVTAAPASTTISWTDDTPATVSIDNTSGPTTNVTVVSTNVGDTANLSATDGTLTGTAKVTLGAGKASTLDVQFAPLT